MTWGLDSPGVAGPSPVPATARQVTEDPEAQGQCWAEGRLRRPPPHLPLQGPQCLATAQRAGDSAGVRGPSPPRAVLGQHFEALRALVQPTKGSVWCHPGPVLPGVALRPVLCDTARGKVTPATSPVGCGPGCPVLTWTAGLAATPSQQGKALTCAWGVSPSADRREGASDSRHELTLVPELRTCRACPGGCICLFKDKRSLAQAAIPRAQKSQRLQCFLDVS